MKSTKKICHTKINNSLNLWKSKERKKNERRIATAASWMKNSSVKIVYKSSSSSHLNPNQNHASVSVSRVSSLTNNSLSYTTSATIISYCYRIESATNEMNKNLTIQIHKPNLLYSFLNVVICIYLWLFTLGRIKCQTSRYTDISYGVKNFITLCWVSTYRPRTAPTIFFARWRLPEFLIRFAKFLIRFTQFLLIYGKRTQKWLSPRYLC